ncbi:MAG TPA: hypothetical protein VIH66_02180 [Gammaproteobacteria bacterium]
MFNHKVSRQTKTRGPDSARAGALLLQDQRPLLDEQTGFINHPSGYPIRFSPVDDSRHTRLDDIPADPHFGLIFHSEVYIKPGQLLEVTISLPDSTEMFIGRVVLIRRHSDHYEIGFCLTGTEAASRLRIVEQICHIETYMRQKKFIDGPYSCNRDRLTREWIAAYAAKVPTL